MDSPQYDNYKKYFSTFGLSPNSKSNSNSKSSLNFRYTPTSKRGRVTPSKRRISPKPAKNLKTKERFSPHRDKNLFGMRKKVKANVPEDEITLSSPRLNSNKKSVKLRKKMKKAVTKFDNIMSILDEGSNEDSGLTNFSVEDFDDLMSKSKENIVVQEEKLESHKRDEVIQATQVEESDYDSDKNEIIEATQVEERDDDENDNLADAEDWMRYDKTFSEHIKDEPKKVAQTLTVIPQTQYESDYCEEVVIFDDKKLSNELIVSSPIEDASSREVEFKRIVVKYLSLKLNKYHPRIKATIYDEISTKMTAEMLDCYKLKRSRSNMLEIKSQFDNSIDALVENCVLTVKDGYKVNVRYICLDGRLHRKPYSAVGHIVKSLNSAEVSNEFNYEKVEKEIKAETKNDENDVGDLMTALASYYEKDTLLVIAIKNAHLFLQAGHHNMRVLYGLMDSAYNNTPGTGRMFVVCSYNDNLYMDRRITSRFDKVVHYVYDLTPDAATKFLFDCLKIQKLPQLNQYFDLIAEWNHNLAIFFKECDTVSLRWQEFSSAKLVSFCKHMIFYFNKRKTFRLKFEEEDYKQSFKAIGCLSYLTLLDLCSIEYSFLLAALYVTLVKHAEKFNFELLYHIYKEQIAKQESTETTHKSFTLNYFKQLIKNQLFYKVDQNTTVSNDCYDWYKLGYTVSELQDWLQQLKDEKRLNNFTSDWFTQIQSQFIL